MELFTRTEGLQLSHTVIRSFRDRTKTWNPTKITVSNQDCEKKKEYCLSSESFQNMCFNTS